MIDWFSSKGWNDNVMGWLVIIIAGYRLWWL